jgi:hypothetical protein
MITDRAITRADWRSVIRHLSFLIAAGQYATMKKAMIALSIVG